MSPHIKPCGWKSQTGPPKMSKDSKMVQPGLSTSHVMLHGQLSCSYLRSQVAIISVDDSSDLDEITSSYRTGQSRLYSDIFSRLGDQILVMHGSAYWILGFVVEKNEQSNKLNLVATQSPHDGEFKAQWRY